MIVLEMKLNTSFCLQALHLNRYTEPFGLCCYFEDEDLGS